MGNKLQFFLSLIFCTLSIQSNAQMYHFSRVSGTITANGKAVTNGSEIDANVELKIKPGAVAIVMSTSGGRFTIPKSGASKSSEMNAFLKDLISPYKKTAQAGARGAGTEVMDLETYFTNDDFLILTDTLTFHLDPKIYPLDSEKSFLVFAYQYDGQTLGQKIPFKGTLISIDRTKIFIDKTNNPIPREEIKNVQVFYYKDATTGDREEITTFNPVFLSLEDLKSTLDFFVTTETYQAETDDVGRYYQIYSFVAEVYGSISDEHTFNNFLVEQGYIHDKNLTFDRERYKEEKGE